MDHFVNSCEFKKSDAHYDIKPRLHQRFCSCTGDFKKSRRLRDNNISKDKLNVKKYTIRAQSYKI